MIYTESITHSFAASHVLEGHSWCGKVHGHSYRVEVTIKADPVWNTQEWLKSTTKFAERVDALVAELRNRHLNDMLSGVYPNPAGIAGWFAERLRMHVPLYEVSVWQDEWRASVLLA